MTEKVYMASGNRRCRESRFHTDPDCDRLSVASNPVPIARSSVAGKYEVCKVCSGQKRNGESAGHYSSLLEAAKGTGD